MARRGWRDDLDRLAREASLTRSVRIDAGWHEARGWARRVGRAALVRDLGALALDEWLDAGIDDLPPDIASALERVAPGVDHETIASYPSEGLAGLVSSVKGGLLEQQVLEGLADGRLGEIVLPDGASVELGGFTDAGLDARVLGDDGALIDVVQIKASDSADLIVRHLERYPEIDQIWTTHEAALDAAARGLPALDTGISDEQLQASVAGVLQDQASTSIGEVLDEVIPQVTLILVALAWVAARRAGIEPAVAKRMAVERAKQAMVASSAAGIAARLTGTEVVRLPVVIGVRLLAARGAASARTADHLRGLGRVISTATTASNGTP